MTISRMRISDIIRSSVWVDAMFSSKTLRERIYRKTNNSACKEYKGLDFNSLLNVFPEEKMTLFSDSDKPCIAIRNWCFSLLFSAACVHDK